MFECLRRLFKRNILYYEAIDDSTGARGEFKFKLARLRDGEYRAYVLDRPPLNGRDGRMSKVHMLRDCLNPYVCVVNKIVDRKKMIAVAKLWARKYLRYVTTGKLFEE